MELLQDNLQNLHTKILSNPIHKKIFLAIKCYLARACNTVRCPEIIQLNHYVDEFYATHRSPSKKVILSPTQVPLPIAYFVNYSLIKRDESKLFYIDSSSREGGGTIETHPYEHVIPALLALFADCNPSSSSHSLYKGPLLISSILLAGEISISISRSKILNAYDATCLAVTFVIGIIWKLSRETIAHVFDNILSSDNVIDMQTCLQYISVATCSPNWFMNHYDATKRTDALLHSIIEIIVSIQQEFPGLEVLQFCLINLNPLTSLLATTLYNDCLNPVTIIINKRMFGANIGGQLSDENYVRNIREQLARFIRWNESNEDLGFYKMKWPITDDLVDSIRVELIDSEINKTNITMSQNTRPDKTFTISNALATLSSLDHLKLLGIGDSLHWVLGVAATQIIFENIDNFISNQDLVPDALSLVFERPGLD